MYNKKAEYVTVNQSRVGMPRAEETEQTALKNSLMENNGIGIEVRNR